MKPKLPANKKKAPTPVGLKRVVSRVFIPAKAYQWQPGAKIKDVYNEHDCQVLGGCKCKVKRRAFVAVGNAVTLACPGMWIVDDALGLRRVLNEQEFKNVKAANIVLDRSSAKQK